MPEIEISENREQCVHAQRGLTECLGEIEAVYENILKYATAEETSWWSGNKRDNFIKDMAMRKEQFDALKKQIQRECQFFEHWNSSLGQITNIFEELLSCINQLN